MFRSTLKMPCAHAAESEQVQRENAPTMTSTSTPQDPWTLPRAAYQASDPLTDCLVILTRFFQRPFSAQTLTAGLPLEQGRLTPELFTRAADRALKADDIAQDVFLSVLNNAGVPATIRREKGHDIDAACGQLRLKTEKELAIN